MKKVIAVSSNGGHWIQMQRAIKAFETSESCRSNLDLVLVKADSTAASDEDSLYVIRDFNKKSFLKLFLCLWEIIKIMLVEKPNLILSTGAAPGALFCLVGKVFFAKVIWIDSMANSERLSQSGRYVSLFADDCFTQWEHLATKKIKYIGKIL